ncbi:predicted protein [Chaetomium globosum CBS 148.51]|uniref:Uncharacterized protein n=1 Tax=Chaetomium globosum (strain ATCC 6205 / CBS 148.51 / DSM 1962 / NBRC 6347 / NRRL 1970) TaxID=306901 RepID=Q2HCX0_CHAGB|nr:uncharacterized protein CHGG_01934 [Chaetomium globosum CBS 148.51]EAQ93699.1 predicted protein [Chaetomium globosum CBS 148.51]
MPRSNTPDRRPPLASSVSAPNIFCRPMEPGPAPVVYINGWNGVGKETVAEYLTLLLGNDNALLVDVRSVGRETASSSSCCGGGHTSKHKHRRRHEHHPLLTPEHPRYFSPDLDADAHDFSPLPSPSFSTFSFSPPPSRSASFSSSSTATTSTSYTSTTPTTTKPSSTIPSDKNKTLSPTHNHHHPLPPPPAAAPAPAPTTTTATTSPTPPYHTHTHTHTHDPDPNPNPNPTPPCSSENLTALLTRPSNGARIAVLPACCPDTAAGRAALRTFEAAAARAGRLFIGVVLRCREGGGGAGCGGGGGGCGSGTGSGGGVGRRVGLNTGVGGGGGGGVGMGGGAVVPVGRVAAARGRVASVGRLDSVLMSSFSASSLSSGRRSGEGEAAAEDGEKGDGDDRNGGGGGQKGLMTASFLGEDTRGYQEARGRRFSLSGTETETGDGTGAGTGTEVGVCWVRRWEPDLGLARPTKAGLTVDASCLPPFEVALQIIEFVKGLQAEKDAELCSSICSAATAPAEGPEGGGKRDQPDLRATPVTKPHRLQGHKTRAGSSVDRWLYPRIVTHQLPNDHDLPAALRRIRGRNDTPGTASRRFTHDSRRKAPRLRYGCSRRVGSMAGEGVYMSRILAMTGARVM